MGKKYTEDADADSLTIDSSMRDEEINRLLPSQSGLQPADTAFLFQVRTNGRDSATGPNGVAR